MNTLLYLSLGFNVLLLFLICRKPLKRACLTIKKAKTDKKASPEIETNTPRVTNKHLKEIAVECETLLPEEDRGKVKLLIDDKYAQLAALQIGELRISLCRYKHSRSLFVPGTFLDALRLACEGYEGTGRYIPVPREVYFVLSQCRIINVYLEALGLETISARDNFWCVDVETGWNTGWKRFRWDIDVAFAKLHHLARIRTGGKKYARNTASLEAKLFLLLKGWDYMFVEV